MAPQLRHADKRAFRIRNASWPIINLSTKARAPLSAAIHICHQEVAMMKQVLAVTFALSLTGASLALAQQGPEGGGARWRPNAEDAAAFTDARIAGLKAGLKLTPDQEKNWPAVEAAIRDLAKDRADRTKARMERMAALREARRGGDNAQLGSAQPGAAQPGPDAIARLREGADAMTTRAAN